MFEKFFRLSENGSDAKTEVIGGATTFVAMAYIIFVQPAVLQIAGMDFGAVMVATCLSAALATLVMGLYANYPICQAPLMGENFFFVFTVAIGMKLGWQAALGAVFISGVIFLLLTFAKVRELVADSVPEGIKYSIAAGIGLFIALIGLQQAGIVVRGEPLLKLGDLHGRPQLVAVVGIVATAALMLLKVRGAILWGMLASAATGLAAGVVKFHGIVSAPPSLAPTFLKLDIPGALTVAAAPAILLLLFMLMFDTIGTLLGVSTQAGFLRDGKLPRINKALVSDAVGTVAGSLLGTSTVSSYIEAAAGVQSGARTGLANVVTALLFLLAIFFSPLVKTVGGGYAVPGTNPPVMLYPVTAAGLIVVGSLMMSAVRHIRWDDATEAIPAFMTLVGIPFTFNIADGLSFGLILHPVCKLFAGRAREVSALMWVLAAIFVLRYAFLAV
ncbi:MAG: NCS2 family permease [Deltaproteobacteria bacterium]|nr:NCS2 family permease [Deltaproteobacteria bacterium]